MWENNYDNLSFCQIIKVLDQATHCSLGVAENNQPYVVPMFYSFEISEEDIIFILHSPQTGEKMNCMYANSKVSLEFESNQCKNSMSTVIVKGDVIKFVKIKDNGCLDNYVKIIIKTREISGRRYYYCNSK